MPRIQQKKINILNEFITHRQYNIQKTHFFFECAAFIAAQTFLTVPTIAFADKNLEFSSMMTGNAR